MAYFYEVKSENRNSARGFNTPCDLDAGLPGLGAHVQSDQLPVIRTWAAIMALVVAWDSTA